MSDMTRPNSPGWHYSRFARWRGPVSTLLWWLAGICIVLAVLVLGVIEYPRLVS